MKNIFLKLVTYLYYFSLAVLLILYLFPGSIIGYLFYGDSGSQPDLIQNPIGTSINHLFAFFYLSIISMISNMNRKNSNQTVIFLITLSIILELTHYFIPNRSFQFLDIFGNLFGVLLAIVIILIYKKYKRIL
ncbi:VanZ family protein [Pelagibacteraceae bacterium]|nr:VanZ family protein [Pelagibacteraceae bacterium]